MGIGAALGGILASRGSRTGGLYVMSLFDLGEGGLRGRFDLLIHVRVYFGAWAAGIGIAPIGGPFGTLSPLISLNCTLSL